MRKQYLSLTFILGLLFITNHIRSQIVVSEIISPFQVEIQNQGNDTVNVDQFWLCDRPIYDRIGSLDVDCGTLNMAPGAFLVVTTNLEMSREGDELAIFSTGQFNDPASIEDFVIWGISGADSRETVAVNAGIWTDGERAPAYTTETSLIYDGDGNAASDYYLGQSNQCATNIPPCDVAGGTVMTGEGLSEATICVDDATADTVMVNVSDNIGANSAWIVTDTNMNIISIDSTNQIVIDSSGSGICLIWHLSFEDGLTGAEIDSNAANLMGCFALSDSLRVIKQSGSDCPPPPCEISGGTIETGNAETEISICVDDIDSDLLEINLTGATGTNSAWVVTDTNLNILSIDTSNIINFDSSSAGVCLIWHVSFEDGLTGAVVDSNAANLMGCFSLSNSVKVTKLAGSDCPPPPCEVSGGTITAGDDQTEISICIDDVESDLVEVSLTGATGTNSAWVVTDTNMNILSVDTSNIINFDSSSAGVCLIWHLSFEDGLTGAVVDSNAANLMGCFSLSNSVKVTKLAGQDCPSQVCEANGGMILASNGLTEISVCVDDGIEEIVEANVTGAVGSNQVWIVTDTNNVIIAIETTRVFNLEPLGPGESLVWHLSFEDISGAELGNNLADLSGCFSLSNSITVHRLAGENCPPPPCEVVAGQLSIEGGGVEIDICAGDGMSDSFDVIVEGSMGSNNAWVITDTNGVILALPAGPPFDLEDSGPGVCLVWHVVFEDSLSGLVVDSSASDISGCYALSNAIRVNRSSGADCPLPPCEVSGGNLTTGDNLTEVSICVDDDNEELVEANISGATGTSSLWIVTDTSLNILSVDTNNVFNLESSGAGVCLIWHVSYEDSLAGAEVDSSASNLSGCFALSNSIRVTKLAGSDCPITDCAAIGGTLTTSSGSQEVVVCGGSGSSEAFDIVLDGAEGSRSAWVITDTSGAILGFPLAPPFNLSGASPGVYQIWHLSYEGSISGASLGANISNLEGCIDLSNPINIHRVDVQSGSIMFSDSSTTKTLCVGTGNSESLDVLVDGGEGTSLAWVITDTSGVILDDPGSGPFDFEDSGAGVCLIWAIHHGGDLTGLEVGLNANDLTGCFAISNPLTVVRNTVVGGMLSTEIGATELIVCVGDSIADPLNLTISGASGDNSTYLITDTAGVIIEVSQDASFDIDALDPGTCFIWHLTSTGNVSGLEVGLNSNNLSGCFALSNSVNLTKLSGDDCPPPCTAQSGTISGLDGGDEITICVDDNLPDDFELNIENASGENLAYVVTDDAGNILGIEETFRLNLEGTGAGLILVRYIAYSNDANIPEEGGNINALTGCFALSNIFTINRVTGGDCTDVCAVDGGTLSSESGGDLTFCVDDGDADLVQVSVSGSSGDSNIFVITDAAANIIKLTDIGSFDFEGTGSGSCLIWHLTYQDSIAGLEEGANANDLMGCFDLSNPITVLRNIDDDCPNLCMTDGGTITTAEGDSLTFCAGDVFFTVTHVSNAEDTTASYWYIVTDDDGTILEWRNSTDSPDFDLSRAPGGVCRVYGYNTLDESLLAEGINIADLEVDCGVLSSNYINVVRQDDGECAEGCHAPRDIRIRKIGSPNRWTIQWDRVNDARNFTLLVGYEGVETSFSEVPVRRNRLNITGPPGRIIVIRIKSECGFGESSEYSREIRLVVESSIGSQAAIGRSLGIQHGTRLPSGIIISEQALAYPNPAADRITIWYAGEGIEGHLSIFDQTGRRIIFRNINGIEEFHSVDISELNDGIYFIMVESEGQMLMQDKLIKSSY